MADLKWLDGIDTYVEEQMQVWKVPGLAMAIVKDGEVVHAKGYGFKDVKKKKKMTADTILPIGSASKSFTGLATAILADEGKLDWDTPVREYIKGFRMFDPVASEQVTTRDMLSHRTGLPRHDIMWIGAPFSRKELVRRVEFLESNAPFRSVAQYQNHMFATVGYAIEQITGKTWEEFVKERIFDKLGMKNSNFSVNDSQKADDYALPYRHDKDKNIVPTEFMVLDGAGPAGSINSSVNEMTNWIKLQLDKGKFGGEQIVSEEKFAETHKAQVHGPEMPFGFDEILFPSYGLGWFMEAYRGYKVVHHGGNTIGFTALVSLIPEKNAGFVILTNMNSTFVTYVLQNDLNDRILGLSKLDWSAKWKDTIDKLYAEGDKAKAAEEAKKVADAPPTHPLDAYVGEYTNPGYNSVVVSKDGAGLKAEYNGVDMTLEHFHYNRFDMTMEAFDMTFQVSFSVSKDGKVDGLSLPIEPALGKDIVFVKKEVETEDKSAKKKGKQKKNSK